jgi:hypothetical protein
VPTGAVFSVTRKRVPISSRTGMRDRVAAGVGHPPDATSPLLDQAERVEEAADHSVAEFGHASVEVVHGKAEGQQPWALH